MKYISTRGSAPPLDFESAALTGLARDGGLYVPQAWPALSLAEIASFAGRSYADVATAVMRPFIGEAMSEPELCSLVNGAYARFRHAAVAPLVQTGPNHWILELFHGPTLAFKDFAMQVLAPIMDRALKRRRERATIVAATSGDTGGAAIEAFRGRASIDIFVLHPRGRVSDIQRRQMTTASEANVHNIAVNGNFDDAQAIVKALFNDLAFRDRYKLSAVNSINWARIMAQTVYYFTAAVALGAPFRPVSFTVPTGNFGDIFAGYVARKMGLPIRRLVIATNINDILVRTFRTGRYEPASVVPTSSPSMDIQVSSNFERLLFDLAGRDAGRVCTMMESLQQSGAFELGAGELKALRAVFSAHSVSEEETAAAIAKLYKDTGYIADPHTAVGVAASWSEAGDPAVPMVCLSTAHPAKFPEVIEKAIGLRPALPKPIGAKLSHPERFDILDNDVEQVASYISANVHAHMEADT